MQAILKSNDKGFWFTVRNDNSLSGYGVYKSVSTMRTIYFTTTDEATTELSKMYPNAIIVTANEYALETNRRNTIYDKALVDARANNNGRLSIGWVAPFKVSG